MLVALPVRLPTKVVEVTEFNPTNDVTVPPNETEVDPITTALFVNALFGILVSDEPLPLNVPALSTLVFGL